MAERLLYSIEEVAAALGVSRKVAYGLRARHPAFPPPVPLGPRVTKYAADDLRVFVATVKAEAKPQPEPERLARGRASFWELPPDQREARKAEKAAQRAARAARKAARLADLAGCAEPSAATPQPVRAMAEEGSVEPQKAGA